MIEKLLDLSKAIFEKGGLASLGLCLSCVVLLSIPHYFPENKELTNWISGHRLSITLAGLFSFCFSLVFSLPFLSKQFKTVFEFARATILKRKIRDSFIKNVYELSDSEWLVLAHCVKNNRAFINLPMDSPVAKILQHRGYLIPAQGLNSMLSCTFLIPGDVFGYLKDHPEFSAESLTNSEKALADFENNLS